MGEYNIIAFRKTTDVPDLSMFEMHAHDVYEIFCFLSGEAEYYVEGTVYPLSPGDILILKKAEAHSLLIKSCSPYERIVIFFSPDNLRGSLAHELLSVLDNRPLGKYNRYPAANIENRHWIFLMNEMCNTTCPDRRAAYLNALLWQLYDTYPMLHNGKVARADSFSDVIQYINEHLAENLSVPALCNKFFISKPQLNRKFKKITGSSVWNYIITKRLHLAKDLILNGTTAAEACVKSGFNDYSSFYRSYRAHFGISPKQDLRK